MLTRPFSFTGAGGQRLAGSLDLPSTGEPRAHALFAHCFTCTRSSRAAIAISAALADAGIGVLRFDFTGLGASEGEFAGSTFSSSVADLTAAAEMMQSVGRGPQLLVGHSLGGAAVLAAAASLPGVTAVAVIGAPFRPDHAEGLLGDRLKVILETGQAAVDLGAGPFTVRREFVEDLRRQDSAIVVRGLRRALLVLQSPVDQIVSLSNASEIFQAAHHPKSFVSLDQADHLLLRPADGRYAADVIAAWAERYLPTHGARVGPPLGTVELEETGTGRFRTHIRTATADLTADEPTTSGGSGEGSTPFELLSSALGACTLMTMRLQAEQTGVAVEPLAVTVTHRKDKAAVPPDIFERTIHLPEGVGPVLRERLLKAAERCPVHKALTVGAQVVTIAQATAASHRTGPPDPALPL